MAATPAGRTPVAAYQALSPELQRFAESLWAIHTNKYGYAAQHSYGSQAERRRYEDVFARKIYETRHPVVRIHPETGEKTLLLGQFVQRLEGQTHADSQALSLCPLSEPHDPARKHRALEL